MNPATKMLIDDYKRMSDDTALLAIKLEQIAGLVRYLYPDKHKLLMGMVNKMNEDARAYRREADAILPTPPLVQRTPLNMAVELACL